jgi:hypothetical protein
MTRKQRIQDFRKQMCARLAARPKPRPDLAAPPRYDEVFGEGVEWLDNLSRLDRWE